MTLRCLVLSRFVLFSPQRADIFPRRIFLSAPYCRVYRASRGLPIDLVTPFPSSSLVVVECSISCLLSFTFFSLLEKQSLIKLRVGVSPLELLPLPGIVS